jgi:tetratricopeptide (TPR) repeat protein
VLLRRRIVLLRVVLFSFLLLLVSPVAHAEKRVALVIGNSAYRPQGELTNPRNDATDVAAALKMHGFQVIEGFDLDKVALDRKLRDFAAALAGADVGLFFYAGHGLQVEGRNYIIPIDAQLRTLAQLEVETTRFDVVQRIMESEKRTNILFLDACRNNPFARNLAQAMGTRSTAIGRGLAHAQSGHGTLISFSTQPDNTAEDGIGRRNSPFTGALVRHLSSSNDEIMGLLVDVRVDVMQETNGKQIPWEHTALTSRFYFKSGANQEAGQVARSQVVFDRGKAALDRRDFDRAIAELNEAIRLDPNNSHAFSNRGFAYLRKDNSDPERAKADFNEAIRLDLKNFEALSGRGAVYTMNKDFDRAFADLNQAIRLEPKYANAYVNRGNVYESKKDYDRAIADYNEAIRLDPQLPRAFHYRGISYAKKNDLDRAIADYSEAIRLTPKSAPAYMIRGNAYYRKNEFDRAMADYREVITLNPQNAWGHYNLGRAKKMKGDRSGDADIAKARQLDPSVGK